MLSVITTISLGTLGYYLSSTKKNTNQKNVISKNELPSANNIYHNRHLNDVAAGHIDKAQKHYQLTSDYDYSISRGYPTPTWQQNRKSEGDRIIHLADKDTQLFAKQHKDTQLLAKEHNVKSIDLQGLASTSTSLNHKRHRMPKMSNYKIGVTSNNEPILKTKFGNCKNVTVYGKQTHNNMEPFIGSSKSIHAKNNNTLLEHFGNSSALYRSKKESGVRNPLQPTTYDPSIGILEHNHRDLSRYKIGNNKKHILPFSQVKVPPGVNNRNNSSPTHGYQHTYRPLGKGAFKTLENLRVNPKNVYKGKVVGEHILEPYGSVLFAPLVSRKIKATFTNAIGKQKLPTRELLQIHNTVDTKPSILNKKSVILKQQTRADQGSVNPGGSVNISRNKTYNFDTAKGTIRQETEVNKNDKINVYNDTRAKTYNFDTAKGTIREQTEVNKNDKINVHSNDTRATTYYFDTAKGTIREQTEVNKNDKINVHPTDTRAATYYFDTAKGTIREQTEVNKNDKINPQAVTEFEQHNILAYENASINGIRELGVVKDRPPTTQGMKFIPDHQHSGKFNINQKQQFDIYSFSNQHDVTAPVNIGAQFIGTETKKKTQYPRDMIYQSQRIDPMMTCAFNKNPYTHSLQSWQLPYNKKYPNVNVVNNKMFKSIYKRK
jgi:hypothetical protein